MFEIWNQFRKTTFGNNVFPVIMHYGTYRRTYQFLLKSQWWSQSELREYQSKQLSKLIHHSYRNVPYYKKLFDKIRLKPTGIRDVSDLQKIPFLTKQIINENINDFNAKNYPKKKFESITTGGTTGIPLRLYLEKDVWFAKDIAYSKILF